MQVIENTFGKKNKGGGFVISESYTAMAIKTIWLCRRAGVQCHGRNQGSRNKPHRYGLLMLHAGAKNSVERMCREQDSHSRRM